MLSIRKDRGVDQMEFKQENNSNNNNNNNNLKSTQSKKHIKCKRNNQYQLIYLG